MTAAGRWLGDGYRGADDRRPRTGGRGDDHQRALRAPYAGTDDRAGRAPGHPRVGRRTEHEQAGLPGAMREDPFGHSLGDLRRHARGLLGAERGAHDRSEVVLRAKPFLPARLSARATGPLPGSTAAAGPPSRRGDGLRAARLTRWCRWPHPSSERRMAMYPVNFSVDYPDRALNRVTTFFRIFTVIPIAIVLG